MIPPVGSGGCEMLLLIMLYVIALAVYLFGEA